MSIEVIFTRNWIVILAWLFDTAFYDQLQNKVWLDQIWPGHPIGIKGLQCLFTKRGIDDIMIVSLTTLVAHSIWICSLQVKLCSYCKNINDLEVSSILCGFCMALRVPTGTSFKITFKEEGDKWWVLNHRCKNKFPQECGCVPTQYIHIKCWCVNMTRLKITSIWKV